MPKFQLKDKDSPKFQELDLFTQGYIEALFFADTGDSEDLEDVGFCDLSKETLRQICFDCRDFQEKAKEHIKEANYSRADQYNYQELAGHDFWFTRNGHGCGFWDGDWEESVGETLTEFCKTYGETYVYRGDDGKVHLG